MYFLQRLLRSPERRTETGGWAICTQEQFVANPWREAGIGVQYAAFARQSWYQNVLDAFLAFAPPPGDGLLVDIGSGTGVGTEALQRARGNGGTVLGIDTSQPIVDYANAAHKGKSGMQFMCGDVLHAASHLSPQPSAIYCINAIHLLPETEKVFVTCRSLLGEQGFVAFCSGFFKEALDRSTAMPWIALLKRMKTIAANRFLDEATSVRERTQPPLSVPQVRDSLIASGFSSVRVAFYEARLPRDSLHAFISIPGMVGDVLPPTIPAQERIEIMRQAVNESSNEYFERRWCFMSAHI